MSRTPRIGPEDGRLAEAVRVGLGYAMRTAETRTLALQTAAAALEQRLIGETTTSAKMTVAKLLDSAEQLTPDDRRAILVAAELGDDSVRLIGLDTAARARLAAALRAAI